MLSDVADWVQIIGLPLAIVALILAWLTSRMQMLLALDARLADYEQVRKDINANKSMDKIDDVELRRYIAAFERVGLALKYRQVSRKAVRHFYGHRFENLINYIRDNPAAEEIVKNPKGWKDFYYLKKRLAKPPSSGVTPADG
jgi:hypothetical protein